MCTPAHMASSLCIFTQMQHFIVGFKCTCIAQAFLSCWQKKEQWKIVLDWGFSCNPQVACVSKRLAMASQLVIPVPLCSAWGEYLFIFQGVAHTWLQWTMFCTEVPAEVWAIYTSIRFWKRIFSELSPLLCRCTSEHMLQQWHVPIKPTQLGVAWLETPSDLFDMWQCVRLGVALKEPSLRKTFSKMTEDLKESTGEKEWRKPAI